MNVYLPMAVFVMILGAADWAYWKLDNAEEVKVDFKLSRTMHSSSNILI